MHQYFVYDADMEHLIIDSTVVRAHPCAAGASKKLAVKRPRLLAEVEEGSVPKYM